jgi:hypothetical protein
MVPEKRHSVRQEAKRKTLGQITDVYHSVRQEAWRKTLGHNTDVSISKTRSLQKHFKTCHY